MESYDLIVVGLGAVGSAALCQAAQRGARVLGIDRFHPPHAFGSSHGETRITRQAVGEGPEFVPLVLRANELWRALEAATGERLRVENGGLILLDDERAQGPGAEFYRQTVECARRFGIAHEILDADEIRERYPQFAVPETAAGYFEPEAGFLYPEKCIGAQLTVAVTNCAQVRAGEIVTGIVTDSSGVTVTTDRGCYGAGGVVLTPGPWMAEWARRICGLEEGYFAVYRQTLYWFALQGTGLQFCPEQMPIFLWSSAEVKKGFYGFPSLDGESVKMATEQFERLSDPNEGAGMVSSEQVQDFFEGYVRPSVRGVTDRCVRSATCFYTVIPGHGFVIDQSVESDRVWFASACSGHGFKHSAAVGEALAQKVLGERVRVDLGPFAR